MMKKSDSANELAVIARSPFEIHYEGQALALSAKNKVGMFDILPGHADFFSVLDPCDVTIQTTDKPIMVRIKNGIITVRDDQVMLFVNM